MSVELPDTRQLSDEVLEALRLRALRGCELGFTQGEIAEILGVARETVSRWWSAFTAGGLEGLPQDRTGRPPGIGRTLSEEQCQRIRELLEGKSPEQLGIAAPLWSRKAVRALIEKEFGIRMPVRTVGEYLKRWGYTAKRPQRRARDQDPKEVQTWREETYPAIENLAEEEDGEIHWADETGVAADEHPGKGYAPEGQPATKEVPNHHIRANLISSITNEGDLFFMTYKRTMDAPLFITFLEELLKTTTKKIFLIVDGLRAHDCKLMDQWRAEHSERIELFFLPAYYPEGNATEYLNQDLKQEVNAEGLPANDDQLQSNIHRFMQWLMQMPERVKAYFQHPAVQYAAAE